MKFKRLSFYPGTRSSCGSPPTLGGCNRVEEELGQDTQASRESVVVSVAAAASIIIAVLGLMGYIPGLDVLGRVQGDYIPMAPSTAVSFLLLGGILLGPARSSWHPRWGTIARAVALLVALFGLLEVIGPIVGKDLNFEDTLVPSAGHLGSIPVARMSPSTGGVFVLAGLAALMLLIQATGHDRRVTVAHWSGVLGSLVLVGGLVFLLAYIQGTPLLYGEGSTVPMAVTTALAFLMLGIATVAASGKDGIPLRLVTGRSTRARLLRVFLPLTTSAVLIASVVVLRAPFLSEVNAALISAGAVVVVAVVTAIVVALTSRSVGDALDRTEAERKQAEEKLRRRTYDLGERVKELRGLYGIAQLIQRPAILLDEIVQGAADLIPPAWQYPEVTCARISLGGEEFQTANFRETPWRQTSGIRASGEQIGSVEICYLEERPESDEGPFLKEERSLIDAIAQQLGEVTERKLAEEEIGESRQLLEDVAQGTGDGILVLSRDFEVLWANRAVLQLYGKSADQVVGHTCYGLTHGRDSVCQPPLDPCPVQRLLESGDSEIVTHAHIDRRGKKRLVEVAAYPIEDSNGDIVKFVHVSRDVTERKEAEERITFLSLHDELTGLPNRTLLRDRFNVALAQARRNKRTVAALFLDLDRFKVVNDTIGHAGGDQLLQSAAERLTGLVREGDTVARVGGDEFAVLLPDIVGVEEATEVAERAMEACRRPWDLDGQEFHVTTSIGIAVYPNDGEDAESLIRNADTAMYRAKEQGRDNYQTFTAAMNVAVVERLALENDLRQGLERDEFIVHYQPQVDISSGRMVGTEALVRWQHPERGLVSPAEIIPVAEETGLIVPLGTWVLQTACAQNAAWQQSGYPPMPVAVNLSARQFQERDLLELVTQALEESGMDPRYLQLEITEGAAMQDVESTITTLRALREMGVQIAIDDFGTGYSSLSYLKRFPIDVLKIDRSFVRDLTVDPDDAAIASAIIAMAKILSLKVIAEGVETEEQLAFLKEHGCDEMQGFLFSKPVPAQALEKMLARDSRPRALARKPG